MYIYIYLFIFFFSVLQINPCEFKRENGAGYILTMKSKENYFADPLPHSNIQHPPHLSVSVCLLELQMTGILKKNSIDSKYSMLVRVTLKIITL